MKSVTPLGYDIPISSTQSHRDGCIVTNRLQWISDKDNPIIWTGWNLAHNESFI
jgi:hypothetical protein